MADTVNIKWTKDIDGNLVSPRSLMDGIQDTDGTTLKRYISTSATTDGILTLEEYNALSETEKMSGRVFCVESDGDAWNANNIAYTDDLTVADKLDTIGTTDISSIGDGKITGAISELNDTLNKRYTLIWENDSPATAFASQTITLSDTSYEFIRVECSVSDSSTGQDLLVNEDVRIGKGCDLTRIVRSTSSAYFGIRQRRVTYNTDGTVTFEDCYTQTPTTVATVKNDNLIPQRIYGIK